MAQIFHPSANTIARATLFGAVSFLAGLLWLISALNRSPYVTQAGVTRDQPVPFSHKLHAGGLGFDCRHCHTSVENSAFAGMPPTKTCMQCHSQVWSDSPALEPVRASFRDDQSLAWTRVADLPDFACFDHSIHIQKGVGCVTCHGRLDQMPLAWNEYAFHMAWCMDCHRYPERYVRPREQVFSMTWQPPHDQLSFGRRLVREYRIRRVTDCSACHR